MNEQLFSGLTSGVQVGSNIISQWMANKANMELAKYSYDQQRQMIQEQNEYNSPIRQMERYKEAGLNPNLMFGGIQSGQQGEIAKYDAPTVQPVSPGNIPQIIGEAIRSSMQNKLLQADLDLRHQQFENLKEEQFRIRAERHARDIDNMYNSWVTGFDPGLVSQVGDMDKVASSLRAHQANASLQSTEAMTAFRNASKAMIQVQTEVNKLNKREKEYFVNEIQPIMRDIMDLRKKGMDTSNKLLELQEKFFRADKFVGYGQALVNGISRFINPVSLFTPTMPGNGTSRSGLGSYTYDDFGSYMGGF